MNTLTHLWTAIRNQPPADVAVEVRFADGSSDLLLWTGARWFPHHPGKTALAWRLVPELDDLQVSA